MNKVFLPWDSLRLQPVGMRRRAALLRCSALCLLSHRVESLGASYYRTAGLVVSCVDEALFGGIIHRSCCAPVLPSASGSLSLLLSFVVVRRARQQLLPSPEDVLLACLGRSSVRFARSFSAHHWKCSLSLKGPGPGAAPCRWNRTS